MPAIANGQHQIKLAIVSISEHPRRHALLTYLTVVMCNKVKACPMKRTVTAKKNLEFDPHAFLSTIGKGRTHDVF